nr:bHLH45 [Pinus massoniana]
MNTFPIFSRSHTDTYNDSFIGSLFVHSPWETHHQPATTKCPPRYWLFDQPPPLTTDNVVLDEYTSSQFGFMPEEYHYHQSPGILPINSLELQPYDKEYSGPTSSCTKKAFHNARERHRRKTLKVLYSQLSSLLPNLNPKKKLSIPNTVSRVLKYIPELLNKVEKLNRKRAKLIAATKQSIRGSSVVGSKSARITGAKELIEFMRSPPPLPANTGSPNHLSVAVNEGFGSSEMIVTICNCRVGILFSTLLVFLGMEGLDVLNASTFISQDKVCYNLHLQMIAGRGQLDPNLLQKKLLSLFSHKSSPHNKASK